MENIDSDEMSILDWIIAFCCIMLVIAVGMGIYNLFFYKEPLPDPKSRPNFGYIKDQIYVPICSYERVDIHGGIREVEMYSDQPFSINGVEAKQFNGDVNSITRQFKYTPHKDQYPLRYIEYFEHRYDKGSEEGFYYKLVLLDRRFFITKPDNACISFVTDRYCPIIVSDNISSQDRRSRINLRDLPDKRYINVNQLNLDKYQKIRSNDRSEIEVSFSSLDSFSINGIKSKNNSLDLKASEFKIDYHDRIVYAVLKTRKSDITVSR